MAGVEQNESEILQEILSCSGPANEEEIVHIIQDDSEAAEEGQSVQESEEEMNSGMCWLSVLLVSYSSYFVMPERKEDGEERKVYLFLLGKCCRVSVVGAKCCHVLESWCCSADC